MIGDYEWVPPEQMFLTYCPVPKKRTITKLFRVHIAEPTERPALRRLDEWPITTTVRHYVVELQEYAYIPVLRERVHVLYGWDPKTRTVFMQQPVVYWIPPGLDIHEHFESVWQKVPAAYVHSWHPGPEPYEALLRKAGHRPPQGLERVHAWVVWAFGRGE